MNFEIKYLKEQDALYIGVIHKDDSANTCFAVSEDKDKFSHMLQLALNTLLNGTPVCSYEDGKVKHHKPFTEGIFID